MQMKSNQLSKAPLSRRQFLKSAGTAAVGAIAVSGAQMIHPSLVSALVQTADSLKTKESSNTAERWYDVKSYGAKGNGIDDDTEAVQSAINAGVTIGGGNSRVVVYFPGGTYRVSSLTVPHHQVLLKGELGAGARILLTSASGNGVTVWSVTGQS